MKFGSGVFFKQLSKPTMKGISCNSNLLSDLPVEQAIDVLAEHGYGAIDICLEIAPPFVPIPTPHMSPKDDLATRDRIRERAAQAGIAIAALNAHTNICARDPDLRRVNAKFLKDSIQLAADLGAPIVVTAGGGKDAYGYERWFFDWAVNTLRQVLPSADRLGVLLAVEAGSPAGSLIHDLKTMQRLLAADGLDSVRALFDTAHYYIRGDEPTEVFKVLQDRIVHMHAKDAKGDPENITFPPLGQGEVDFDALLREMAAAGFDGYIAMEYEAFAWDFPKDPKKVLSESKAFLDRLVAKHWRSGS